MKKKRSLNSIIDSLIDKDGIKTEVTVTVTQETLFKIVGALLASGLSILLINHLLKNSFPSKQLTQLVSEVSLIKNHLQS